MFSATSDCQEEDDDDDDDELSPGYTAAAAAAKSLHDDDTADDEFLYKVLTADQLVQHMVDCIKEVNTVVQVY